MTTDRIIIQPASTPLVTIKNTALGVIHQTGASKLTVTETPRQALGIQLSGRQGPEGRVYAGFFAVGPFISRELIALLSSPGAGTLHANYCSAYAAEHCTAETIWKITKNGTFADPIHATDSEITTNLFCTVTFPPGDDDAEFVFAGADPLRGTVALKDKLRFWEPNTPDVTQGSVTMTLASA